jgi:hypothetical protein
MPRNLDMARETRRVQTLSSRLGDPFEAADAFKLEALKAQLIATLRSSPVPLRSRLPDPMDAAKEFRSLWIGLQKRT